MERFVEIFNIVIRLLSSKVLALLNLVNIVGKILRHCRFIIRKVDD